MSEFAPLAARAFARPATTAIGAWWTRRKDRQMIALQAPSALPHQGCKNGPHASPRESAVSNWSASRVFDVQLHLPGATGDEIATIGKSTLAPGETWRVDWGVPRGSGKVPLLHPDEHGHYDVVMNLLWADTPGGPLWQRGTDGKARRAPEHTAWRRMLRSVRGRLPAGWTLRLRSR